MGGTHNYYQTVAGSGTRPLKLLANCTTSSHRVPSADPLALSGFGTDQQWLYVKRVTPSPAVFDIPNSCYSARCPSTAHHPREMFQFSYPLCNLLLVGVFSCDFNGTAPSFADFMLERYHHRN